MTSNAGHALGAIHGLLLIGLALVALRSWMATSILKWPEHIFSDPWATAAFTNFVAGLPLILAHVWTTFESPAAALAWSAGIVVLGHAVTMLYGMVRVWNHETVHEALLPERVGLPTEQQQQVSGAARTLQVITGLALALYSIFGIRALIVEDQRVGYAYVTRNYWPLTLFLNTAVGEIFSAVYIAVREGTTGNGSVAVALAWILAIVLFGNAATCVYLIVALNSARSIHDAVLGRYPVGTRGGYTPVT